MAINPALFTANLLQTLANHANQLRAHLAQLPTSPALIDQMLDTFADLVRAAMGAAGSAPRKGEMMAGVVMAAVAVTNEVRTALEDIRNDHALLVSNRVELETKIEASHAAWDAAADDLEEQANTLIAKVGSSFDATVEGIAQRAEEDRKEFLAAAVDANAAADRLLDELKAKLGIAADITLSNHYGKKADDEELEAARLRDRAVAYGTVTAAVAAVAAIIQTVAAGLDWNYDALETLPAKLAVVLPLAAIARYYGGQATRHRLYSEHLRDAELELRNIGPYLAELDVHQRAQVRADLVPAFFGRKGPRVTEDAPTPGATVEQLLDVVKTLADRSR